MASKRSELDVTVRWWAKLLIAFMPIAICMLFIAFGTIAEEVSWRICAWVDAGDR